MKGVLTLALFLASVGALGCGDSPLPLLPSPTATVVRIVVGCGKWTTAGATCQLGVYFSDGGYLFSGGGYEREGGGFHRLTDAVWESSDTTVATVVATDAGGRVTFLAPGVITIRVTYQGFTASAPVSTVRSG